LGVNLGRHIVTNGTLRCGSSQITLGRTCCVMDPCGRLSVSFPVLFTLCIFVQYRLSCCLLNNLTLQVLSVVVIHTHVRADVFDS